MRYLYGDSKPFPGGHDFLAALEALIASAARAVLLETRAKEIQSKADLAHASRLDADEDLEKVHRSVLATVQKTASSSLQPRLAEYARLVSDYATGIVEETKKASARLTEKEQTEARQEGQRLRAEVRDLLETMLRAMRLPVVGTTVTQRLVEGRNDLSAVFSHPDGLDTNMTLSTDRIADWRRPRKVSEFAKGLDLMVGVKKSWIGRAVKPDMVHLDDLFISGFDLGDDAAEIRLRKKADGPDTLLFNVRRDGDGLIAEAHHPGDAEAEARLPSTVDAGDRVQLERLWQLLRTGCAEALQYRQRMLWARVDGRDIFEELLVIPFVERVIRLIAPTVHEIARRSPNTRELSLKIEHDDGRREEIYTKKEALLSHLEPLAEKQQAIFAPLKIARDEWLSVSDVVLEEG